MQTVCGVLLLSLHLPGVSFGQSSLIKSDVLFHEQNGELAVEAEHFQSQTNADVRAFYLTHADSEAGPGPDGDAAHLVGASNNAYLEILPDTRRTHGDKLQRGVNFSPQPGKMAVLHYPVFVETPGTYYVWVRAHSTGSEDNGLHVGLDGEWPETGQRLQWCQGKKTWRWESKQRTEKQHCGEPGRIFLEIDEPGRHTIHFSMREDGFEFDRWLITTDPEFERPTGVGPATKLKSGTLPKSYRPVKTNPSSAKSSGKSNMGDRAVSQELPTTSPTKNSSDRLIQQPRLENGDGSVLVSGELKQWHKVTLSLAGPFAHEKDNRPNPFTDLSMTVKFTHSDGRSYSVPGYFAADGDAADSSAESGTVWKAHFAPDLTGQWSYTVSFRSGRDAALDAEANSEPVSPFDGVKGTFVVQKTDKTAPDFRSKGRLQYVGRRYLQHAGSKTYFQKAGADAPETLLAFKDFDNTIAGNAKKAPLKSWMAHVQDWTDADPSWKNGKGKGLIGAVNYLSSKGCNAFSFLTYNAGGDGDNVWPFVQREDKLHYDCSKLDQWGIVFDHGTAKGMYLHFKMQETENDDHRRGKSGKLVPESLDGGNLGRQRKLYCRELIARFGHNLALNWNLGEENTQSTAQQKDMINFIKATDPYDHPIVVHTYPDQQDRVYKALIGDKSNLTGVSLQNSALETTHKQTVKWIRESEKSGKPWVVAFDESGSAAHAQCPDLGYKGFDGHDQTGKKTHTQHEVRKYTLWGTLMAGGAGNEYYFGYRYVENDIVCEDWRSRDQSWDYCRIALEFFADNHIPFWEMDSSDRLIGNPKNESTKFCLAKQNELYLVYLCSGGTTDIDLTNGTGSFSIEWFNPRIGGALQQGSVVSLDAGKSVSIGRPPADHAEDWLAVIRRK